MAECLMVEKCANHIQRQVIRVPDAMRIPLSTKISPLQSLKSLHACQKGPATDEAKMAINKINKQKQN